MKMMKWLACITTLLAAQTAHAQQDPKRETLKSGEYHVTQSWSQEESFERPYHVRVPDAKDKQRKLPVLVFLHGNGGNAPEAMRGFIRGRGKIASRYILVFPQGYRESWNIVSERSKADDLRFIESIVLKLATFENVDPNNFTIMGASNGAALVNQLAIESRLPNIRNYISGVSQLNVWQYDGKHFKAKGDDNNYRNVASPAKGKRLLNISGVKDRLVPYHGGPSSVIPAKDGKLAFVDAEESTFLWARQMGYEGEQLHRPSRTIENAEVFSYLDGNVVHYKVTNEGHGATHGISEQLLLDFLDAAPDGTPGFSDVAEPKRDIAYDTKHERNVLDFWPAPKSDEPAPVLIWFHPGGFRDGDKSQLEKNRRSMLQAYRNAGYAVVSCNYPFLSDDIDHLEIARHCARAVQFVRSKATDWNIDSHRLCCGGVSAGALISEFLAYHDNFADPSARDVISRQSSRPAVVISIMQPRGTEEFALRFMDKGEAPIFIYSDAKPSDRIHPPWAAIMLRDKAQELGIPCVAFGGGRNKLPTVEKGKTWLELQLEFCQKHLAK
jgi:poly(3-hydroxybutyrate) depolymerase